MSAFELRLIVLAAGLAACSPRPASTDADSEGSGTGTEEASESNGGDPPPDLPEDFDPPERAEYVIVGEENILASADGAEWINLPAAALGGARFLSRVDKSEDGTFVAVGGSSIASSEDGIFWQVGEGPEAEHVFTDVVAGSGRWVAVGKEATIAVSEDGFDWEIVEPEVPGELNDPSIVVHADGRWIAAREGPHAFDDPFFTLQSTNGLDWQPIEFPALTLSMDYPAPDLHLLHLSHVGDEFIVAIHERPWPQPPPEVRVHMLTSPDGETWTDTLLSDVDPDDHIFYPLIEGSECMEQRNGEWLTAAWIWGIDWPSTALIRSADGVAWAPLEQDHGREIGHPRACAQADDGIWVLASLDIEGTRLYRAQSLDEFTWVQLPAHSSWLSDLAM